MKQAPSRPTATPRPPAETLTEIFEVTHGIFNSLEEVVTTMVNKLGVGLPGNAVAGAPSVSLLESSLQIAVRAQSLLDTVIVINNAL